MYVCCIIVIKIIKKRKRLGQIRKRENSEKKYVCVFICRVVVALQSILDQISARLYPKNTIQPSKINAQAG